MYLYQNIIMFTLPLHFDGTKGRMFYPVDPQQTRKPCCKENE